MEHSFQDQRVIDRDGEIAHQLPLESDEGNLITVSATFFRVLIEQATAVGDASASLSQGQFYVCHQFTLDTAAFSSPCRVLSGAAA